MQWSVYKIIFTIITLAYGIEVESIILKKNRIRSDLALAWSLGLNILLLGIAAMILSLFGLFSLYGTLAVYLSVNTLAGGIFWKLQKNNNHQANSIKGKKNYAEVVAISVILTVSAVIYLAFPTNYLWSGRDYGLYIVNAVHTAETGSSIYETDTFLTENYEELKDVVEIGYPALYSSYDDGISDDPGKINAQFLPLYWCLLAFGYSLAGMAGLLRTTAVITVITLYMYYIFVKNLSNWKLASVATFLLAMCPAEIWGARITQSEQLAQLIFILMASLFSYGWSEKKNIYIYMAIAVVGVGCFCRIDNYILGLGILCMAIYTVLWNRSQYQVMRNAAVQYGVWFIISLIYGFLVHYHYYWEHWRKGVLKWLVLANIALFVLYIILLWVNKKEYTNAVESVCKNHKTKNILVLLVFICYIYVIMRAKLAGDTPSALQQYSWYICPLTFIFAIFGVGRFVSTENNEYDAMIEPYLLFIGIGSISTILYSVKPSIVMDHFWMSRRFVPVNFPFLIFFGIYGVWKLWDEKNQYKKICKTIGISCICIIFLYVGYRDKVILNRAAYEGYAEGYQNLQKVLPDQTLILTESKGTAAVLRYIYHKNVYMVKEDMSRDSIYQYLKNHDGVYYVGNLAGLGAQCGVDVKEIYEGAVTAVAPENPMERYPVSWNDVGQEMDLFYITKDEDHTDSIDLLHTIYLMNGTVRVDDKIVLENQGYSFFGPYYKLEQGHYELELQIENISEQDVVTLGTMEIVANEEVKNSYVITNQEESWKIPVDIDDSEAIMQFRFAKQMDQEIIIDQLKLTYVKFQ